MIHPFSKTAILAATLATATFSQIHATGVADFEVPAKMRAEWTKMNASAPKQKARENFNQNKYGMFIHWGLYSQLGGVWKGQKMEEGGTGPKVAEWIMRNKEIPRAEYAKLTKTFNPVDFDADAWVAVAKAAGMNYMVITSKHHDGFALFDSDVSDYNVVDATPFKRDIIRELEQACERGGIDFGVYYSHALDWKDGGDSGMKDYGPKKRPKKKVFINTFDPAPVKFDDYIANKSLPQVRELLANYDLTEIWFDTPIYIPPHHSFEFYKTVYAANPEILVTQRIGNNMGDIGTPGDNVIPGEASENTWEGIATTNHSWGFKSYDTDWKSPTETLYWLLENTSKGGNFLLNVGPDAKGKIPQESIDNLLAAGEWLKVNGEAIYGSKPWTTTSEGPSTIKKSKPGASHKFDQQVTPQHFWFTRKGEHLYVSALKRPKGNTVTIQALKGVPIKSVSVLGESGEVKWKESGDGIEVTLPQLKSETQGYALKIKL